MANKICVVELTFKRIQQFLFAVPRLKAMLGANALLGETIREDLVKLVENHNPHSVTVTNAPTKYSEDPIDDDPFALYKKGIISRDGGHFTAAFTSEKDAKAFINAAQQKVLDKLPGVMLEASLRTESDSEFKAKKITTATHFGETSTRLPQLRVCEDTGTEIANHERSQNPEYVSDPEYVSEQVNALETAGDRFRKGKTKDIIGQLIAKKKLPGTQKNTEAETSGEDQAKDNSNIPKDLKELAGQSGYIAVIHADGNSIGIRRKLYAGNNEKPANFDEYIENEVKNEQFFHSMRTTIRQCVLAALEKVFPDDEIKQHKKLPYQLLMLGGDDLLLITQPQYAFPFVIEYSNKLKDKSIPYKGEEIKPISIGAGIAIASHNIPFYHLHHLAESLASSAKKLYRVQGAENDETPEERSVVDWLVATTSWIDDIEVSCQQDDLQEKDGVLYCTSAKPYFVLPDPEADDDEKNTDSFNLEMLWDSAKQIAKQYHQDEKEGVGNEEKLPRSKLKALLETISQFDMEKSKKHYQKITPLPKEFKQLFSEKGERLWQEIEGNQLTQYKDLMELIELHFLGQQTKSSGQPSTNDQDQQEEHHG